MGNDISDAPVSVVGDTELHDPPRPSRTKADIADEIHKKIEGRVQWDGRARIKKASNGKSKQDFKKEEVEEEENEEETTTHVQDNSGSSAKDREGETQESDRQAEERNEDLRVGERVASSPSEPGRESATVKDLIHEALDKGATTADFFAASLRPIKVRFGLPDIEVTEEFDLCQLFGPEDQSAPQELLFTLGYRTERETDITKPRAQREVAVTIGADCADSVYFSSVQRLPLTFTSQTLGYTFLLFFVTLTDAEKAFIQSEQESP